MNDPDSIPAALFQYVLVAGLSAAATGYLASRKNRSTVTWAIAGVLFPGFAFVAVWFAACLCPECRRPVTGTEWTAKGCPRCRGSRPKESESFSQNPHECPLCGADLPPGTRKCPNCEWS